MHSTNTNKKNLPEGNAIKNLLFVEKTKLALNYSNLDHNNVVVELKLKKTSALEFRANLVF